MKIATTTVDFDSFCGTDAERLRELHRAGFRYVDLSMYSLTSRSLYMCDGWRDEVLKLRELASELGMTFVQAHSPGGNPLWQDEARVEYLLRSTIRSIEVCGVLGIKNTVVHPGARRDICKEEWFALNKPFYEKLFPAMERCGVNVLCENCGEIEGYFVLSSAERANKLIELVNHPQFGICWDTGHANINGHQYDHIKALGNNLRALHINDNRGIDDEHMAPFFGTVNMDEIINALLDIDYKGYFTFECGYSLRPTDLYLGARRRFEKDTRLLYPTLEMQSDMTNFLYKMGRHILNAYNIFEE
jgi:sugar phosphate isomerase/epimerase